MSPAREQHTPGGSRPEPPIQREELARLVHRALHHLYEPVELQLSPLAGLLGLDKTADTAARLRQALLDAIRELKPGPRAPLDSNAWRIYQLLTYLFEEQAGQEAVASQMAVSPRQVRRLERAAIDALAAILVSRFGIAVAEDEPARGLEPTLPGALLPREGEPAGIEQEGSTGTAHEQELDWLRRSYLLDSASPGELVRSVLATSESLVAACGCQVDAQVAPSLPDVLGQATILRQALLNLVISAAQAASAAAPGGRVAVRAGLDMTAGERVYIEISASTPASPPEPFDAGDHLELARRLLGISGGSLDLPPQPAAAGQVFAARALLPVAKPVDILVVDDNDDSLRLFERCLEGTRFRFTGERDPHRVIERAEHSNPRLIILDIMLPGIDGWELLGRLRAHPRLGSTPVVISTILPHEELARSLGAAGFVRKPIRREALLELLGQLV